jgi:hypothetical protein
MKTKFLTAAFIFISLAASAQYGYRDSNMIGIILGGNQLNLNTNNFETKPEMGWNVGLSMRGNFYNDFDMVYGIQFSENKFSVPTHNAALTKEDVHIKLPSAQISLMLSYKIVENILSVEFGPVIQVNDKFNIDSKDKTNTIDRAALKLDGTPLLAGDIVKISHLNLYPTAGITAGVRNFRANLQYLYGVTNMLGKLNNSENGLQHFKGNASILSGNIIFYF